MMDIMWYIYIYMYKYIWWMYDGYNVILCSYMCMCNQVCYVYKYKIYAIIYILLTYIYI